MSSEVTRRHSSSILSSKSANQKSFKSENILSRITVLLIFKLIDLLYQKSTSQRLKSLIQDFYKKKLDTLIDYFIEFDLDSKGITNLAFYSEEEFLEVKKKFT
jgi:hypothetical protein